MPWNPGKQWHTPELHSPLPWQLRGHSCTESVRKTKRDREKEGRVQRVRCQASKHFIKSLAAFILQRTTKLKARRVTMLHRHQTQIHSSRICRVALPPLSVSRRTVWREYTSNHFLKTTSMNPSPRLHRLRQKKNKIKKLNPAKFHQELLSQLSNFPLIVRRPTQTGWKVRRVLIRSSNRRC